MDDGKPFDVSLETGLPLLVDGGVVSGQAGGRGSVQSGPPGALHARAQPQQKHDPAAAPRAERGRALTATHPRVRGSKVRPEVSNKLLLSDSSRVSTREGEGKSQIH